MARSIAASHVDDLDKILAAMRYVGENLAYDPRRNRDQFTRSAEDLFRDKTLGGCSEYALAQLALVKALGYPARLVLTVNAKWIERRRHNDLATPNGHALIEIRFNNAWFLLDPTSFVIYDRYDPSARFLPGNEILVSRAGDFAAAGIASVQDSMDFLTQAAENFAGVYRKPDLPTLAALKFDYPAAFATLGRVFLDTGDTIQAARLARKALELDPRHVPALLLRAELRLAEGQADLARTDLDAARRISPDDPALSALADKLAR